MCSDFGSEAPVLRVEGLERRIRRKPILRGVDLEVRRGEVVGLLGPNGAGKTTTFRAIAGIDRPDKGNVVFRGQELGTLPLHLRARRGLGYLPQEPSVFRGLTVEENVALVLELPSRGRAREGRARSRDEGREGRARGGGARLRDEARRVLAEFGLAALSHQRAATLSGGERRRLELARAVCRSPWLLLCDEPLTGVDPKAAAELRGMLRALATRGISVLLTDHNVNEALRACDRAYLLVGGVVAEAGTSSELMASSRARALYFGDADGLGWAPGAGREEAS